MNQTILNNDYETVHYGLWDRSNWNTRDCYRIDDEPDRAYWIDAGTGLPCLMKRGRLGFWCGYVAVPEGHPLYGQGYSGIDVDVHGGLTYAEACQEDNKETGICHITKDGDTAWWFGFDCGHSMDRSPWMSMRYGNDWQQSYRTMNYVRSEVEKLASQLAAIR